MLSIKTILVPIDLGDPSDAALAYAVDVAEATHASVFVLYAFELPVVGLPDGTLVPTADFASRITTAGQAALDRALAKHKGRRIQIDGSGASPSASCASRRSRC